MTAKNDATTSAAVVVAVVVVVEVDMMMLMSIMLWHLDLYECVYICVCGYIYMSVCVCNVIAI